MPNAFHCRGFGLVEALVALVVISIGLLGVAGLQAYGASYNTVAAARSIGALHALSMMDLMRANICGVMNTDHPNWPQQCNPLVDNSFSYQNRSSLEPLPSGLQAITDPGTGNYCETAGAACNSQQQAAADLWQMAQAVANDLPEGRLTVECYESPCTNASTYAITVTWQEKQIVRDADGSFKSVNRVNGVDQSVEQRFSTVFQP
ncbi:MAG: type IV pilus modification protein PilV [Gammaproteobacteria bacterium]